MEALMRREAQEELRRAAAWYEEHRVGLGGSFLDDFLGVIEQMENNPKLYAEIEVGLRRAILTRFPYAIFYSVEQTHIQILALKHCHGDPQNWPRGT